MFSLKISLEISVPYQTKSRKVLVKSTKEKKKESKNENGIAIRSGTTTHTCMKFQVNIFLP